MEYAIYIGTHMVSSSLLNTRRLYLLCCTFSQPVDEKFQCRHPMILSSLKATLYVLLRMSFSGLCAAGCATHRREQPKAANGARVTWPATD